MVTVDVQLIIVPKYVHCGYNTRMENGKYKASDRELPKKSKNTVADQNSVNSSLIVLGHLSPYLVTFVLGLRHGLSPRTLKRVPQLCLFKNLGIGFAVCILHIADRLMV